MSKILELAKAFEQTSKQEAQTMTESVKTAIKQHEQDLIALLTDANKSLEAVIQAERAKLIKSAVRLWRLPSLIMGALMLLALIALGLMTWQSKQSYQEMVEWRRLTENYQAISQGLEITKCKVSDDQSQYCIRIDPNYKGQYWGNQGNLAILPHKVEQ